MLEVKIDKILPVTEARDNFNNLVDEVETTDELYVLTKNGKPCAVIVGVHHLEKLTGTSHEVLMGAVAGGINEATQSDSIAPTDEITTPQADPSSSLEQTTEKKEDLNETEIPSFNPDPIMIAPEETKENDSTPASIDLTNFREDPVEENEPDPLPNSMPTSNLNSPIGTADSNNTFSQASSINSAPFDSSLPNAQSLDTAATETIIQQTPSSANIPIENNQNTPQPSPEAQTESNDDPLDFLSNLDNGNTEPSADLNSIDTNPLQPQATDIGSSPLNEPLPEEAPQNTASNNPSGSIPTNTQFPQQPNQQNTQL